MNNNLTIISRRENFTAQAIINGNTVTFAYEKTNNQVTAGAFTVQRGAKGSPEFKQEEAFRGSFYGQKLRLHEVNDFQKGDGVLCDEIYDVCRNIITLESQEPQEPEADDTSV
ncbi:hypothetical protein ACILDT_11350 [Capnocytophaga canis]|uniref:hypothetical protein n=1 Tax=Capnocytophaga canis TaxID=1848903 RepID=UPI0037D3704B